MKRLRMILGTLAVLIILGIMLSLFLKNRKGEEEAVTKDIAGTEAQGPASVEAQEIKYTESEGGKTLWEIVAKEAKFYQDKGVTDFKNIQVTFYYKDNYELHLLGEEGDLNNETKDINLRKNVTITMSNDYVLKTDSLNYNAVTKKISTDAPITITGPDINFAGEGLSFDLGKDELFINSDIVTDFTGKKGSKPQGDTSETAGFDDVTSLEGTLHVTSGGLYGNQKLNYIQYTNGVIASHREATLRAGTVTIYFKKNMKDITRIEARGNVRLVRSDITATCGLLTFDYEKKLLTLENNPVIVRGEDKITGDKILYYLDEKKSVALGGEKARAHVTIYPKEKF